jgi:signal peptidase I
MRERGAGEATTEREPPLVRQTPSAIMPRVVNRLAQLRRSSVFELIFIVAIALSLALAVQAYAVKPYRIPSRSMEPTLTVGDRVLVNRASHRLGAEPKVGDIVVFHPPAGADAQPAACGAGDTGEGTEAPCARPTAKQSDQTFIKRVVALGGDTVALRDGHVIRNGRRATEPFAVACRQGDDCDYPRAITVPPGSVYLLGDNRPGSLDSRYWGPVPVGWVIGEAVAEYWPPRRVGTL